MKRALVLLVALIAGAVIGAGATVAMQGGDADADRARDARPSSPEASTTATAPATGSAAVVAAPTEQLLLAWSSGGLSDGLEAAAAATPGVHASAIVRGDPANLVGSIDATGIPLQRTDPGWSIPVDTIAIDPGTYALVVAAADRTAVAGLGHGEALLGSTAARLRGVGPGGRLLYTSGQQVTIAAVVPDEAISGAEVAVDVATGAALGIETPRALIVAYEGDRGALEAALTNASPPGTALRFRAPGETPFLRAADAVLPQSLIKDAFGEFAYRVPDAAQRDIEIDPAWIEANIVTPDLPVIGEVRCHRAVIPALEGAMRELGEKNLAGTIPDGGYDGCWVPRLVGPGLPLSRHAWGVAIDLNYGLNPTGVNSTQDPRLVEIMERWGFAWGGRWLVPDPAHFEYVMPAASR